MKKFENVLIEKDTIMLSSEFIKIQGFDCKHEVWKWDGIKAESLVFYKYDFDGFMGWAGGVGWGLGGGFLPY